MSCRPGWKPSIVISGTVASCAVTYEIVRRIRVLRPLFGLKTGKLYVPSGLSRLECDHAASPRSRGRRWPRHGISAATPHRSMPRAARPAGWSRRRRAAIAGRGRRAAPQCRLYVRRNRGQCAGADAGASARRRTSGQKIVGLGDRARLGARRRAVSGGGDRHRRRHALGLLDLDRLRAMLEAGRRRWCR